MFKKNLLIALICLVIFTSCGNDKTAKENTKNNTDSLLTEKIDTLAYTLKEAKASYLPPESKAGDEETYAKISYLDFKDSSMNTFLTAQFSDDTVKNKVVSFQGKADDFIVQYKDYLGEMEDKSFIISQYLEDRMSCAVNYSDFMSISYAGENFTGGAHGSHYQIYLNFNPKTKQIYRIQDIIAPNTFSDLTAIGKKIFMQDEKLKNDKDFKEKYFFDKGIFNLPANFTFTSKGILFYYNEYEIKAYVYGPTQLIIPYSSINQNIISNSLLATLIKRLQKS